MPELPEVETIRAGLALRVSGRQVGDVEVRHERATRRNPGGAAELRSRLVGAVPDAAVRRGKYLWLPLAGTRRALVVHLGMSGQLLVRDPAAAREPAPAHLRIRVVFDDGGELWFVDQRTFGHALVAPLVPTPDGAPGGRGSPEPALPEPVTHIARDLLDPAVAPGSRGRAELIGRLRGRRTGVKRALLDQTVVSGIGNIYADEGLWRARENHATTAGALSPARWRILLDAVEAVMTDALAAGGTSFDALYVNVNGASGYFDTSLAAYGRAGQACRRCGATIVREAFANRSSFRCPRCQPGASPDDGPAGQSRSADVQRT